MENNMTNNIYNHVNNFVITDEGVIHMNNKVRDGYEPVNEGGTMNDDLCNMSLLYEYINLKWKYLALDRVLSKEALTLKGDV